MLTLDFRVSIYRAVVDETAVGIVGVIIEGIALDMFSTKNKIFYARFGLAVAQLVWPGNWVKTLFFDMTEHGWSR